MAAALKCGIPVDESHPTRGLDINEVMFFLENVGVFFYS
jgi:hypothetical protein